MQIFIPITSNNIIQSFCSTGLTYWSYIYCRPLLYQYLNITEMDIS